MSLIDEIVARAKANKQRIVLPEGTEERTLKAADKIIADEVANIILLGNPTEIKTLAEKNGLKNIDKATIIDPTDHPKKEAYANLLFELRKKKGMTPEQARTALKDTCFFSATMVMAGDAHGYVSGGGNPKGYNHNTASKTRPALQLFKTASGIKTASSCFIMQMPDTKWGYNGVFVYADCGMNINPNADQLAEIAVTTAKTFKDLVGGEPKVGMISCSTKGSAHDPIIDKVVEATAKAKALAPDLAIEGELQFDAAILPEIAAKKAPDSKIAGHCNVLVFPDLNCGNSIYKATERLAGATAIGPLAQGLRRPFMDVSRGCSADDIVDCACVAAITEWAD